MAALVGRVVLNAPLRQLTNNREEPNLQTLRDKMKMSIPHSPAGFKRETWFWRMPHHASFKRASA